MKGSFFFDGASGIRGGALRVVLLLMAAAGILLMLFGGNGGGENKSAARLTEEKIKLLCESVSGVEDVTVAVTLVDALPTSASDGYTGEIKGIGIVCRGGDDPIKAQKLLSLVSAACGVPTNRIYVAGSEK